MDKYYILTFQNTLGAINGESELKERKIKIEIMPTPTSITKSCGISIKVKNEDIDEIKKLVSENRINVKNIYFKDDYGYKIFEF
jgi:Protein of unknown function (DUF3343).